MKVYEVLAGIDHAQPLEIARNNKVLYTSDDCIIPEDMRDLTVYTMHTRKTEYENAMLCIQVI